MLTLPPTTLPLLPLRRGAIFIAAKNLLFFVPRDEFGA
jgi:hypothetical protein